MDELLLPFFKHPVITVIYKDNIIKSRDEDPTFFPWIRIRLSWEKNPDLTPDPT